MMAEYLSVVRPLEVFFSEKFEFRGAMDLNEFMWADYRKGIWDGEFLSDRLQIYTREHGMHGLGLQEYRQVAIAFMEKHVKYNMEDFEECLLDIQAGHSSRTAGMEYARSTEDHRQVGREAMHKFYLISLAWHRLLLQLLSERNGRMRLMSMSLDKVDGQDVSEKNGEMSAELTRQSHLPDVPRSKEPKVQDEQRDNGEDVVMSAAALRALRGLYKDGKAQFKSQEQAEAVRAAMKGSDDLLVILPTGGGKSVVFMAPAWAEKGLTTVVVVPFVALIEEMLQRCVDVGLSCYIWRNHGTIVGQRMAQVVLVGVENAVTAEFQQFLIRLEQAKKLGRIAIDECHTVLTQREFRPVMRRLTSMIRCVEVPVVLLTATLPVEMEERLQSILGCDGMRVIRQRGERLELRYRVLRVPMEKKRVDLDMEVAKILRGKLTEFGENDRAIVYCLKRRWAEDLAEFLNEELGEDVCGTYHAEMELKERREIYSGWKEGEIRCVVATSALGAGIDHSGVRLEPLIRVTVW